MKSEQTMSARSSIRRHTRLGLSAADTDAPQAERVILFFSREQDIEAVTRPSLKKQCFGCLPGVSANEFYGHAA